MAKRGKQRPLVTLACSVCNERNYHTSKNITNTPNRLELNKFCSNCKKRTPHKEAK